MASLNKGVAKNGKRLRLPADFGKQARLAQLDDQHDDARARFTHPV